MQKYFFIFLFLFGMLFLDKAEAQISAGGVPYSFNARDLKSKVSFVSFNCVVPLISKTAKQHQLRLKNLHFAEPIEVAITPENTGVWEDIPNGKSLWRVGIRSDGAYSLNLIFNKFHLPKGGRLFIYTPDYSMVLGAFTEENNRKDNVLATAPLPGDAIVVEYEVPTSLKASGQILIATINHDFKGIFADAGRRPVGLSGSCNREVNCPEGVGWKKQKNAVCRILIAGTDLCTATLLNSTGSDKHPIILTAWHCLGKASKAPTAVCLFNYENAVCGSVDGDASHSISGATYLAGSDSLDFALLELSSTPPPSFQPYYAGWDRSALVSDSTVCIHHPKADNKKLVYSNIQPLTDTYPGFVHDNFWRVPKWINGTTEEGSSGSPLFSDKQLVVGCLTGGESMCSDPVNDYFSKLTRDWDYYPNSAKQLGYWLDPINSGVQSLDGYDPYPSDSACASFVNINADEEVILPVCNTGIGYWSGNNSSLFDEVAEEFSNTESCPLSEIGIGVAKSISPGKNGIVTIKIYQGGDVPEKLVGQTEVLMKDLVAGAINRIYLKQTLQLTGNYFISCKFSYTNPTDTFALYAAAPRGVGKANSSFCRKGNTWSPISKFAGSEFNTSLLIQSMPCDVVFRPETPSGDKEVYGWKYDRYSGVLTVSSTTQEIRTVAIYNLLGQAISHSVLNSNPSAYQIVLSNLVTGVYIARVYTDNNISTFKFNVAQ